jgi:hypothetical protein
MQCTNWMEEDWRTLLFTIQHGNCLLMLGPDASRVLVDGQLRPLTELLAQELFDGLKPEIRENLDPTNLAQVAQYYRMEWGRNDLEAKVYGFYEARWQLTGDLHQQLAALPFHFIMTSTPDNMLCKAFQDAHKEPVVGRYNFHGNNPVMAPSGTKEKPFVFYLYGAIHEPESLVLTENDLLDFLVAVTSENPPLPNNVLSEVRDRSKSLLFLGFGFKHWYLRILLLVLQGREKESRSFALEQGAPENMAVFRSTVLFFRESGYKIQICTQELTGFVRELHERYTKVSAGIAATTTATVLPPQDAPTVFLCHSKQNRDRVEYLRDRLREAGFNAWFDKDDLRGGDEWDRKIERAIAKEIEYFVVLQSQVMTTKLESYFNKEIRMALERQNYFRPGIRFIIPVKIEACPLLEELEHLQTIDLSQKEQVTELISTIKRDQERRKRK